MTSLPGWKRLLLQALEQTPIDTPDSGRTHRWNPLPGLAWRRRALAEAGILNRPPLGLLHTAWLWWCSHGAADTFKSRCLAAVAGSAASKPSLPYLAGASLLLPAGLLLLPGTATTSLSPDGRHPLLQAPRIPGNDHDRLHAGLSLASDYPLAAFPDVSDAFYRAGLHGREWLQQRRNGTFGLQLMSASQPDNLVRFCRQHEICEQSVVIESQVDGRRIWRLLLGDYPDLKSARRAAEDLPAKLKSLGPWPRDWSSLKSGALASR